MALSNAKKQANYRNRKIINGFTRDYLNGSQVVTPESFIDAKTVEHECLNNIVVAQFNQGLINAFYEALKDYHEEDGLYSVDSCFDAWKTAEIER